MLQGLVCAQSSHAAALLLSLVFRLLFFSVHMLRNGAPFPYLGLRVLVPRTPPGPGIAYLVLRFLADARTAA